MVNSVLMFKLMKVCPMRKRRPSHNTYDRTLTERYRLESAYMPWLTLSIPSFLSLKLRSKNGAEEWENGSCNTQQHNLPSWDKWRNMIFINNLKRGCNPPTKKFSKLWGAVDKPEYRADNQKNVSTLEKQTDEVQKNRPHEVQQLQIESYTQGRINICRSTK